MVKAKKLNALVLNGIVYTPQTKVKGVSTPKVLTLEDKAKSLKTFINRKRNTKHIESIKPNGLTKVAEYKGTNYTLKGFDIVYKDGSAIQKFYLECAGYLRSWRQ